MILISGLKLKHLNQDNYESQILSLKDHRDEFVNSIFEEGETIILNGTYGRFFITEHISCPFYLRIQRILCVNSNKTHALIPACLVPYSRVPVEIQIEIIEAKDAIELFDLSVLYNLDLKTLHHLRAIFTSQWKTNFDWFLDPIDVLVAKAVQLKNRQFMQIRSTASLYQPT